MTVTAIPLQFTPDAHCGNSQGRFRPVWPEGRVAILGSAGIHPFSLNQGKEHLDHDAFGTTVPFWHADTR